MHTEDEIEYIKSFINKHEHCKVYLGSDSQRVKKKKVKFATVVIIHYIDEHGQGHGAKVFSDIQYEYITDAKLSRPYNRMMKEVQLITELYESLEEVLIEREFEIHIDVNPEEGTGSNVAYHSAKGMIHSIVGMEPICKPHSWAASCAADKYSK